MSATPLARVSAAAARLLLAAIASWALCQAGCCRSQSRSGSPPAAATTRVLTEAGAASLAARLANDQCERQYRTRPFSAEQHRAVLQNDSYRWGGLDVGGPKGFSALVTFRSDGSEPHVEVYFSSDMLRPEKLAAPPPHPDAGPGIK